MCEQVVSASGGEDPALCAPDINTSGDSSSGDSSDSDIEIQFEAGPLTKFMTIYATIDLFRAPHSALSEFPTGRKDGMFYILDNTSNVEKKQKGHKTEVWDDCGAWKRPSCPKSLYIKKEETLVSLILKNGEYGTDQNINKKRKRAERSRTPTSKRRLMSKD